MDGTSHVAPERFIEEARAALVESSRRLVEVGTYNARDGTFLWAWGHKTLPRHLVAHAGLARAWGRENDMADYTAAIVDCTPEAVWDFAAVTAHLAGREGVYRGRNGSVWLYLTYGDIAMEAAHRADAAVTAAAPDRVEGSRSTSRPPSLSPRAASAASRNPGRFSADFGGVVERGLQRLQTQIGGVVHRPVDCARVSSRLRLSLARRRGQLEPLELMPTHARIGRDDDHLNTVYVPPYFAEQKRRIDLLITAGLVRHGIQRAMQPAMPFCRHAACIIGAIINDPAAAAILFLAGLIIAITQMVLADLLALTERPQCRSDCGAFPPCEDIFQKTHGPSLRSSWAI